MLIFDLLLEVLVLLISFVFLSITAWSTGYITLKLKRGDLQVSDLPSWLRSWWADETRDKVEDESEGVVGAYISMTIGILFICGLVIILGFSWYRHGFTQSVAAGLIALCIWGVMIRWCLRLG